MANSGDSWSDDGLSPNYAFATLGNETRMRILHAVGETDPQRSFLDLRDHVGVEDPGRFNYLLNQLKGHFIQSTAGG